MNLTVSGKIYEVDNIDQSEDEGVGNLSAIDINSDPKEKVFLLLADSLEALQRKMKEAMYTDDFTAYTETHFFGSGTDLSYEDWHKRLIDNPGLYFSSDATKRDVTDVDPEIAEALGFEPTIAFITRSKTL